MRHYPERPTRLTTEQEQALNKRIVEKTPTDVDIPANMNWTSFQVRDCIKKHYDVQYSE